MLGLAGKTLVVTVWISALLFGLYILSFYAASFYSGNMLKWNEILPGLYDASKTTATLGIGLHFAAGGIILILGCIQLIENVRIRFPSFHRWVGRVYITAAIFAAIGGLVFIMVKGTIGGLVMDIGFSLYGVLMFIAAVETFRNAKAKRVEKHRAWALRLFALAIGSWLYRMDYGFWLLLTDGLGHLKDFSGAFDKLMSFFFYIPNLLVAEIFIGRWKFSNQPLVKFFASFVLFLATGFLLVGTYFFTLHYWGPAIVALLNP